MLMPMLHPHTLRSFSMLLQYYCWNFLTLRSSHFHDPEYHADGCMICVTSVRDIYHLFTSFQLNYFHFCVHCYLLALLSSTSYISAASRHPGLKIKIRATVLCAVLNSKVLKGTTTCRGCVRVTMRAGHVSFVTGHRKASPHFRKFKTWRFTCRGLPIQ